MIAYIIRNTINGKAYIGISTKPDVRWGWHRNAANRRDSAPLYNAMNKYGTGNFTFEVIACALNWDDLCEVEKTLIAQHGTYGASGYNSTRGGDGTLGRVHSARERAQRGRKMIGNKNGLVKTEEHRERLRRGSASWKRRQESIAKTAAAHRGMKRSAETRAKISDAGKGRKLTPEHRAKVAAVLSAHRTGHAVSDETRAKIGAANRGREVSAETRQKMSERRRGKKLSDEARRKMILTKTGLAGRPHTEETKAKMRAAHAKRHQMADQTEMSL